MRRRLSSARTGTGPRASLGASGPPGRCPPGGLGAARRGQEGCGAGAGAAAAARGRLRPAQPRCNGAGLLPALIQIPLAAGGGSFPEQQRAVTHLQVPAFESAFFLLLFNFKPQPVRSPPRRPPARSPGRSSPCGDRLFIFYFFSTPAASRQDQSGARPARTVPPPPARAAPSPAPAPSPPRAARQRRGKSRAAPGGTRSTAGGEHEAAAALPSV